MHRAASAMLPRSFGRKPARAKRFVMRTVLAIAAFALLSLTAPASAQSDAADALERMDDPVAIEAMADDLEHVTQAVLGMPIGPLVDALRRIDPDMAADLPDDATVGEAVAADPDLAERVGEEARITGLVAGQSARDLAAALPVLRSMASDLAAQWQQRISDARRNQR